MRRTLFKILTFKTTIYPLGFPQWFSGKESAYQWRRCKRHGFNLWIRKIP